MFWLIQVSFIWWWLFWAFHCIISSFTHFLQLHSHTVKRIGLGFLLPLCSFIMSAIVGNVLLCSSQANVTCLIYHSEVFNVSSDSLWWVLFPSSAYSLGFLLSGITLFEFVFAQTNLNSFIVCVCSNKYKFLYSFCSNSMCHLHVLCFGCIIIVDCFPVWHCGCDDGNLFIMLLSEVLLLLFVKYLYGSFSYWTFVRINY